MALFKRIIVFLFLMPLLLSAQYTDVINSNRPGQSVSAYAVGKNVVQVEWGLLYEQRDHTDFNTVSNIIGSDLSLRYGLLLENLEINYEGTFISQDITFNNFDISERRTDFSRNRLGLKYLVYDPFKNPEANKPNLYSWRANHKFQFKNLLPAVSLYGGATFNLGDNPFYVEDATISYRAMIATQSRLTPRWVLITNVAYDRITTDFPELNYIISLSHAFRNPKWSVFAEHQGIDSDRYSDALLRGGIAHLFSPSFQADFSLGGSFKNTPSRYFFTAGLSYRLDFHKDTLVPIEDQDAIGKIKKGDMKKKKPKKVKKKKRKKKNKDDIDF
ncbi:transporter [uncultured Croceitalea sp.]|uniref:transporter n=1 Tax=uncultured Croceitalea sp. TaxID=1798908 RepID=UPI0033057DD1